MPAIMGSAFGAAGQRCLAGSVAVLVGDRGRQDEVRSRRSPRRPRSSSSAPAPTPTTDVCPLVAPEARERVAEAIERAESPAATRWSLDGRARRRARAGTMLGPYDRRDRRPRVGARARGAVRAVADGRARRATSTRRSSSSTARATATPARSSPPPAAPRAPTARGRGRDAGGERRRSRPGRLVPVLGLEGLDRRRPARQRPRRGRVLHAQEGRHLALADPARGRSARRRSVGSAARREPRQVRGRVRAAWPATRSATPRVGRSRSTARPASSPTTRSRCRPSIDPGLHAASSTWAEPRRLRADDHRAARRDVRGRRLPGGHRGLRRLLDVLRRIAVPQLGRARAATSPTSATRWSRSSTSATRPPPTATTGA